MKITITVEDENLDYFAKAETGSFEIAGQKLSQLADNYMRRIDMELDIRARRRNGGR